jgi:hypothetical protein
MERPNRYLLKVAVESPVSHLWMFLQFVRCLLMVMVDQFLVIVDLFIGLNLLIIFDFVAHCKI